MSYSRTAEPSAFTCLEDAFAALSTAPSPLTFDGRCVPGLADRAIPLAELRALLLRRSTSYTTRDAVVGALLVRAKEEGGRATIALAGLLLPGLRRAAYPLLRACPDRRSDVEADMLVGLLGAIAVVSARRKRPAAHLTGRAFDAAKRSVREELAERGRVTHAPGAAPPQRPYGHPDLVLAEAVLDGVLEPDEAELIGATRLGGLSMQQAASQRGVTYNAVRIRRSRAERCLVAYLRDGCVSDRDVREAPDGSDPARPDPARSDTPCPDTNRPSPDGSTSAKGPRQGRWLRPEIGVVPDLASTNDPRTSCSAGSRRG